MRYSFDGDANDVSGNGNDGTTAGNPGGTDSGWWSYSWNDYELGFCTLKATATDDKGNIKNSIVVVEIVE